MPHDTIPDEGTLVRITANANRFILITGCSGGGKSTLLAELALRGFATCEEPGRAIVKEQLASGGDALPWENIAKFAELAAQRSLQNMARAAQNDGITFFDRGLLDAVCAMERLNLPVPPDIAHAFARCRYRRTVFLSPPWPEIFANDAERKHAFTEAIAEYDYLAKRLSELGYEPAILAKASVEARVDFVLGRLGAMWPTALPPARR